jgi:hypothetical protein
MAVMLSPLGEAMLPKEILSRYRAARNHSDEERSILAKAPEQTRDLLQISRSSSVWPITFIYQPAATTAPGFRKTGQRATRSRWCPGS